MNKDSFATLTELKKRPKEVLSRVQEDPVYLFKRSKIRAVMVDPDLFETMVEVLEDKIDIAALEEARKDTGGGMSLKDFKKRL